MLARLSCGIEKLSSEKSKSLPDSKNTAMTEAKNEELTVDIPAN